jgi:hypothetical protein
MPPKCLLDIYRNVSILYHLPDTGSVYRMVTETDAYGGIENDYRKLHDYPCRLVFKLEDTRAAGGVILQDANYKIHFPFLADLKQNDKIKLKSDVDCDRYFEIISVEYGSEGLFNNAIVKERFN